MIRRMLPLLWILLCVAPGWAGEIPPVEVMGLLGSRDLVGSIPFAPGEARLDPAAAAELDRIATRLSAPETQSKLVRVEGFSAVEETAGEALALAMARTRAVEVYLRETRKVAAEIYLIGVGQRSGSPSSPRVEVALYDKMLPIADAPIDSIIRKW